MREMETTKLSSRKTCIGCIRCVRCQNCVGCTGFDNCVDQIDCNGCTHCEDSIKKPPKMRETTKFWVDKNSNSWSKTKYTKAQSSQLSKTLSHCSCCTDSSNLYDCRSCTNCSHLNHSSNCTNRHDWNNLHEEPQD